MTAVDAAEITRLVKCAADGDNPEAIARDLLSTIDQHREEAVLEGVRLGLEAAWRACWTAEPIPEHPVEKHDLPCFQYGKDCGMVAIRGIDPQAIVGQRKG